MDDTFTSGDIAAAAKESAAPAEASPAPQPTEPTTPPASATTTPGAQPDATKPEDRIPIADHKRVLETTRRDYDAKLNRLSWAERLDRDRVERALALAEQYERQQRQVQTPERPKPNLQTEDGRQLYDAEQAAALVRYEVEQAVREMKEQFIGRLSPIEQTFAQGQQAAAIDAQIASASQWPDFDKHVDAITEVIADANERGERITLEQAYIRVAVPKFAQSREQLEPQIRKAILDELNTTSAAVKDTVNPSRRPPASPKADSEKSLTEMLQEEYAARASG